MTEQVIAELEDAIRHADEVIDCPIVFVGRELAEQILELLKHKNALNRTDMRRN